MSHHKMSQRIYKLILDSMTPMDFYKLLKIVDCKPPCLITGGVNPPVDSWLNELPDEKIMQLRGEEPNHFLLQLLDDKIDADFIKTLEKEGFDKFVRLIANKDPPLATFDWQPILDECQITTEGWAKKLLYKEKLKTIFRFDQTPQLSNMEAELKKIMEEIWKEYYEGEPCSYCTGEDLCFSSVHNSSVCVPVNVMVAISGSKNCSRSLLDYVDKRYGLHEREEIFMESRVLPEILLNGARVGNVNVVNFLDDRGLLYDICHKDIWEAQRMTFGEFYDRIAHMHSSERRLHCAVCQTFI